MLKEKINEKRLSFCIFDHSMLVFFRRPCEITKKDVITEQQIKFLNFLLKYNNLNFFSKQADCSLKTGIMGLSRNGSQVLVAQTVKGRDHKTKRFLDFLLK